MDQPVPNSSELGHISTTLTLTIAAACGISVANLYYAQPLLSTIGKSFHGGTGSTGLIVTASQFGYAAGLAFVVPLGDLFPRKQLVPIALFISALGLIFMAIAPNLVVIIAISAIVGLGSVAAQILVPMAADLACGADRGRVVGTVMTGLLLGILLARTASGAIAGLGSWRTVFGSAGVADVILAIVLSRVLPIEVPREKNRYLGLLKSTAALFLAEPILRRRAVLGGLGFAAFSAFWTTIAFLLSRQPFHESDSVIGLFGLVGAAGALCASSAGRLVDRGHARLTTTLFAAAILVSFLPTYLGRRSIPILVIGIIILDIGVQGLQVTNQSVIYRLAPQARSRITASYMVCYFVGGAFGSAVGSFAYDKFAWAGLCIFGATFGTIATIASLFKPKQRPLVPD